MPDPVPEATSQAIPTACGQGMAPKVLQRSHQSGCTASIVVFEDGEEVD